MLIETKFNIGDIVWFIHDNKVHWASVYALRCDKSSTYTRVTYQLNEFLVCPDFKENELFTTKEELINSL